MRRFVSDRGMIFFNYFNEIFFFYIDIQLFTETIPK